MKVVVAIFEQLVPLSGGGTPRTTHIVRALASRGHQVHVAASFDVPPPQACAELGCADVLPLGYVSRLDENKFAKYLVAFPINIIRLARYIARVQPDLIITHNSIAGLGALVGKIACPKALAVMDLTDLLFEYLGSYSRWWMAMLSRLGKALERYSICHADRVITISKAMAGILHRQYALSIQRTDVVYDGVDSEVFHPMGADALRRQLSPEAEHVCILHGVIDPQDEPGLLVLAAHRVLEEYPQTAFWIVGDGAAVPEIKSQAARLGNANRFVFTGWVGQREVVEHINASDLGLVILPDIASARGRVTLKEFEYWACEKPAILPRLPALQEVVTDGQASLFYTPGDATDLAAKIGTLLADDERRMQMGTVGRTLVTTQYEWRELSLAIARLCEAYIASREATGLAGTSAFRRHE